MRVSVKIGLICVLCLTANGDSHGTVLLDQLLKIITDAVNQQNETRQYQGVYRPPNYGVSSTVYSALQTVAANDELECIPRLLCEAAAGGTPGGNRQINIDKQSLTQLLSYLQVAGVDSSPMLTFGKAALLGFSSRGDPYSCNVNYPKCPRDQERLLHYLNNHRGGFFRFFDMKQVNEHQHHQQQQQNQQYQHQSYNPNRYPNLNYQNGLNYNSYFNKYRPNRPQLYRKPKNDKLEVYAKKYDHSSMSFSPKDYEDYKRHHKTISFPRERNSELGDSIARIQTKVLRPESEYFAFSNSNRVSKKIKGFFPADNALEKPEVLVTDRLPNMYFYLNYRGGKQMKFPVSDVTRSLIFPPH